MKIAIGSDHAGFRLKEYLKAYLEEKGHVVLEQGTVEPKRCDYPDFAIKVCQSIQKREADRGILVCGTGIGMSIAANKCQGIRAAVVTDCFSARATREHNDCNVLCLGERIVGIGLAKSIVEEWCVAEFEGGRHQIRVEKMMQIEDNC